MKKKIQYLIGFFVIVAALVYLMSTSFTSSLQYYLTVKEAVAENSGQYNDRIIKIAGKAKDIKRVEQNNKPAYDFDVVEGDLSINVAYNGFVPDSFKEGADVVVTGTLTSEKHFEATHILAKCSSKYQAKSGASPQPEN